MSNFCVDLESGTFFVYEKTLESDYMQGRFGAVPIIGDNNSPSYFTHIPMKIAEPSKLAKELRKLADKLDGKNIKNNDEEE